MDKTTMATNKAKKKKRQAKPKLVPVKPLLSMIKDIIQARLEFKSRVFNFKEERREKLQQFERLNEALMEASGEIIKLNHLIEMYQVMDEHRVADLWELERVAGLTTAGWSEWNAAFRKKEGREY